MDNSLEEKKNKLLNRYRELFIQKTGFTGNMLDSYVTNLIVIGERQYGSNFTEDIIKEKRDDSILWLMDEVLKSGGIAGLSNVKNKVKDTIQETVNAFAQIANQKFEQEQVSEKEQILELIDKMNEKEFEDYLNELSLTSSNYAKFNGIVNYKKSQNPNESELKISKDVLKSMADEIELVFPQTKQVNKDIYSNATVDNYVMVENTINKNEELTNEQKQEFRNALWSDFDNYVEQNPKGVEKEHEEISNNDSNIMIEPATEKVEEIKPITEENTIIPATARVGKRKPAPKGLVSKFKEKWKNASFKKKILIGAVAIGAIIGVGVITVTAISQMIATQSFDANSVMNAGDMIKASIPLDGSVVDPNTVASVNSVDMNQAVDWSSIGQGTEVHTTLNDALNDTNSLTSNGSMHVDHMEAVNTAGEVVNLDDMSVDQVNQILDSGDYGVRGSSNGTYMGWFDEETVKDAINQGKVL